MPLKRIPTPTQDAGNWGTILNDHLAQTQNPLNGAFNSFDQFSARPTNLTADDVGKTYLYTQTGNWHEWSGSEWIVRDTNDIANIKDYGAIGNTNPATLIGNDDTDAIKLAITKAKLAQHRLSIFIPNGDFKVSDSLEVTGLNVFGLNNKGWIRATQGEFDVFVTTSSSTFNGFSIHGGWKNDTPNLKGNAIYCSNPVFGNIRIYDMIIDFAKENGVKIFRCGYANISSCTIRACGDNCIYLLGLDTGPNGTTTVAINNSTAVSDTPYGYGVKIENCYNITLDTVICETSKGFLVSEGFRTINFLNCYQENIRGEKFLTWGNNANGYNINLIGNFSSKQSIDYNPRVKGLNAFGNTMGDINASGDVTGGVQFGASYGFNQRQEDGGTDTTMEFNRLSTVQSGYTKPPVSLCTYKLWVDATGKLRIKNGVPNSDLDGSLVGV